MAFKKGHTPWKKAVKGIHLSPSSEFKPGAVSWNIWKGGISRAYTTGYYSKEYKDWRKAVFERDEFSCRTCNSKGYITAHHIKSFAHYPELRFELNNGITLCEPCHKLTDNYKGRSKGKRVTILTKV